MWADGEAGNPVSGEGGAQVWGAQLPVGFGSPEGAGWERGDPDAQEESCRWRVPALDTGLKKHSGVLSATTAVCPGAGRCLPEAQGWPSLRGPGPQCSRGSRRRWASWDLPVGPCGPGGAAGSRCCYSHSARTALGSEARRRDSERCSAFTGCSTPPFPSLSICPPQQTLSSFPSCAHVFRTARLSCGGSSRGAVRAQG